MLGQADDLDPAADGARTAVVGDVPDHVWAARRRASATCSPGCSAARRPAVGGLDGHDRRRCPAAQRRRVALAALLPRRRADDVLLLDEPTNHLDVEGVAWLAGHLRARWPAGRARSSSSRTTAGSWTPSASGPGRCTTASSTRYDGGYAAYVLARAERARIAAVTEERRQNLLRKELAWLRRGAPARTSKPRFRIDAADALIADEPPPRDGSRWSGWPRPGSART